MTKKAVVLVTVVVVGLTMARSTPSAVAAQGASVTPPDQQVAAAVLPLPVELRASATVLGYGTDGKLTTLRRGTGTMTCLASDPKGNRFHVACYHNSLEPFMARGRTLRVQGVKDPEVDSVRFREAKARRLKLPSSPASLYSLTGGAFDPSTGTASGARPLFVVYIPYANATTTGLTERPVPGAPWIMFPGTPKAHIMFVPTM